MQQAVPSLCGYPVMAIPNAYIEGMDVNVLPIWLLQIHTWGLNVFFRSIWLLPLLLLQIHTFFFWGGGECVTPVWLLGKCSEMLFLNFEDLGFLYWISTACLSLIIQQFGLKETDKLAISIIKVTLYSVLQTISVSI